MMELISFILFYISLYVFQRAHLINNRFVLERFLSSFLFFFIPSQLCKVVKRMPDGIGNWAVNSAADFRFPISHPSESQGKKRKEKKRKEKKKRWVGGAVWTADTNWPLPRQYQQPVLAL
jgi:hypothetical protein